jgi:8-oxoguanine deaminase
MTTLLVRDADVLVTMNEQRNEIKQGALLVEDNQVIWVGASADADRWLHEQRPDLERAGLTRVINARGCVVMPGMVNCHHHLYQTLTRTIGTERGMVLFDWLKFLYPVWAELTPEAVQVSARVGLSELVLSGCTTVADHLYLYPNGCTIDDEIEAAQAVGVRFHPTRGSMSLGQSQGGLPPDRVCDSEANILADSQRAIESFHDAGRFSMLRIGLAPLFALQRHQ